jgi:hypothetical protein
MDIQNTLGDIEKALNALYFVDMDKVREELVAEARGEIRQELIDEIRAELEDACEQANAGDAPEIGTADTWGQDDAAGLRAFLVQFDANW